ncbi:MAG: erythromycin esterase family protein [Gemmatimonadota bacterium]|nr:MAG: erythromycin esterase family protein [Gemmatimonadota bacterium]
MCSCWLAALLVAALGLACDSVTDQEADVEVQWLQQHVVPIGNADPDVPDAALAVLQQTIGDARLVGLGEATHGTTEFWGIRQKISRYLVEEMGFSAILFEAPLPNGLHINSYVTEGIGTAEEAHRRLGYWRYQEMRDLIDWMRSHNVQRSPGDPLLHFFGYDCAFRSWEESIALIADYLAVVDPAAVADITTRLENYTLEDSEYVYDFIASRRDTYVALSSLESYEITLKIAENLPPSWEVWHNLENNLPEMDIREGFNIENVNWLIEHMLDGGKVIIWAHNGHVGNWYRPDRDTQAQMLGSRLKEQYGDDYYVIATEFYGGRFRAWEYCGGNYTAMIEHVAAQPGDDTYTHLFHQAAIPLFYLDLSKVDYTLPETAWLMGPLKARDIGASYCAAEDSYYYSELSLPDKYDGIVHFETTNPTTPITFDGQAAGLNVLPGRG